MSPEQDSPLRPNALKDLSQLKRRAKELLRAYRAGDPDATRTVEKHFGGPDAERVRLAETQLVLARTLGFRSWARLRDAADAASGDSAKQRWRSRPERLQGKRYVYDVGAVDSDQAWAFFESCRDGDGTDSSPSLRNSRKRCGHEGGLKSKGSSRIVLSSPGQAT